MSVIFNFFAKFFVKEDDIDTVEKVFDSQEDKGNVTINENDEEDECENLCYHKIGKITKVCQDKILIDDFYEYENSDVEFILGCKVTFLIYTEDRSIKVSNVTVVGDDWNETEEKRSRWYVRTIIGKVSEREGRKLIIEPGDLTIDLNEVSSEFIPISGDWLEIEAKCEIDENVTNLNGQIIKIIKIRPIRPNIMTGVVKCWNINMQTGQVNNSIFFNCDSLCVGYLPKIGDRVIAEIIESNQSNCTWRALKVIPHENARSVVDINNFKTRCEVEDFNIIIDENVRVNFANLNDTSSFEMNIANNNPQEVCLTGISFENMSALIKLEYPDKYPVVLKSNENIKVIGNCTIKTAGVSKEILTFKFNHCTLSRHILIQLVGNIHRNYSHDTNRRHQKESLISSTRNYRNNSRKDYIRAPRSNNAPRFIPFKLPPYTVPDKLWNIVLDLPNNDTHLMIEQLKKAKYALAQPLSFEYYEDRFHTLIHLEEIYEIIQMRKYDRDRACFIRNGEYLMLEIDNLAEQRPSLVTGDIIVATGIYNPDGMGFEGPIHKVGANHLFLKFHPKFHNDYKGEDYSIHIKQSRTKTKRLHQAVGLAVRHLGRDILFPTKIVTKPNQLNFYCHDGRNGILPPKTTRLTNRQVMKIFEDSAKRSPEREEDSTKLKLKWFNKKLNMYQKDAVKNTLHGVCRPMPYIIYGPPGTGKTITLVEIILQTLRLIPHSRILVATPSNSAANLVALRLIDSGVVKPGDLVRLVAYKCVVDDTIPANLAPYCATISQAAEGTGSNTPTVARSGMTLGMDFSMVGRQRIVVATCNSVGGLYALPFPKGHFSHIMIDEAGQATEPELMIPLSFLDLSTAQCVLAGDPQQLGPVICSAYSREFGLGESYLERMINRFPYARDIVGFPETAGYDDRVVTKLILNYRSLPSILEVPNKLFYHSELQSTINCEDSSQIKLLRTLESILPAGNCDVLPSFVFHGVNGRDFQMRDCPSWYNPHEVSQIFYYVNQLYRHNLQHSDIGIITPYIKQVKEIRNVLMEAGFDLPKIGTVEDFQGQEFNVVILSTVRSTSDLLETDFRHSLGFVQQPKRMNVALTRAKALLIVVGNPYLLVHDYSWRHVIAHAVKNNAYCGCSLSEAILNSL